jgi:hypothetical protein
VSWHFISAGFFADLLLHFNEVTLIFTFQLRFTSLDRQSNQDRFVPEHEVTEEGVALAHSKIIQKGLGKVARVFQEAGKACKHLYNLQGGKVV